MVMELWKMLNQKYNLEKKIKIKIKGFKGMKVINNFAFLVSRVFSISI